MGKSEIVCLLACNLMTYLCYSVIFPFLPQEFESLNLDSSIYCFIFAIYSFANMIGSLIVGELLEVFKRKSILLLGLISMAFELVLFGLTTYLSSNYETAVISLLIRGFQGVSASMIMTTSYAIVTIVYKENQQQYLGFLESSQGLGLIVGPMIGSTLYTFIGFECTFYCLGLVFAILSIALLFVLPNTVNITQEEECLLNKIQKENSSDFIDTNLNLETIKNNISNGISSNLIIDKQSCNYYGNNESIKYSQIIFRPIVLITSISTFLSVLSISYFESTISIRLEGLGLSTLWIGVFLSLAPFTYTISCLLLPLFTSKFDSKYLICIGLFLNGVSQFLVGPSPFLPDSLALMVIGQLLHGFTICLFLVTCIPVMIENLIENFPENSIEVSDISSVIFGAFQSLGEMLAPIYGINVTSAFSFRICCDTMGWILISYCFFYLIVWRFSVKRTDQIISKIEEL